MSDSARHELYSTPESEYGVTPSTPTWTPLRHTGVTLGTTKTTNVSEELRSDRQIADFRHGNSQVGGEVSAELSYGSFDEILEAVLMGTWNADSLVPGTTRRSFSLMRHFSDQSSADQPFHLYKGVEFNTMQLTATAGQIVKLSFGAIGREQSPPTSTHPTGSTYEAVSTTKVIDTFFGSLLEGSSTDDAVTLNEAGVVTELQLNIENGLSPRFALFDSKTKKPSVGRFNLTGQITAYFENSTFLQRFLASQNRAMSFSLGDTSAQYSFQLPKIIYNGGQPDTTGQGSINITLPFQAMFRTASDYALLITR